MHERVNPAHRSTPDIRYQRELREEGWVWSHIGRGLSLPRAAQSLVGLYKTELIRRLAQVCRAELEGETAAVGPRGCSRRCLR